MKITVLVSGSIAAFKACALVSSLAKEGHEVQAVLSGAALNFVGAASFEGLSSRPVLSDLWENGRAMAHIELRRWSDLFVLYPASADRINQLAAGLAGDLIGSIFLANNLEKPFWIAPAMNAHMLSHPATQDSIAKLRGWGYTIVNGNEGSLACGDIGKGRLAEPEQLFALIEAEARRQTRAFREENRRVLITGGAMDVRIDSVRSIRNSSSGKTASRIAASFLEQGWQVDYLHHANADLKGSEGSNLIPYKEFDDFEAALKSGLSSQNYDLVVHAAAVSDYRVASLSPKDGASKGGSTAAVDGAAFSGKIESSGGLDIQLAANPKLIAHIRSWAKGNPIVVGFKLTSGASESDGRDRAKPTLESGHADFVVWNDSKSYRAFDEHPFVIFGPNDKGQPQKLSEGTSTRELADELYRLATDDPARVPRTKTKEKTTQRSTP